MKVYPTKLGYTAEEKYPNGSTLLHGKSLVAVTMNAIETIFNNAKV